FFFFQAEDGIRDFHVTRVQTCALLLPLGSKIFSSFRQELSKGRIKIPTIYLLKFFMIIVQLLISYFFYPRIHMIHPLKYLLVHYLRSMCILMLDKGFYLVVCLLYLD